MKRLLPLFAALTSWTNQTPLSSWVKETEGRTKQLVAWTIHQPNLDLITPDTKSFFEKNLPLKLDPKIEYHFQDGAAFRKFIHLLYNHCYTLSRKDRQGNFLQNNIWMPLSLYLENLSPEKFSEVYASIMVENPSEKKTQSENAQVAVTTVMTELNSKFRNHTTGELAEVIASSSSTSLVQTGEE